MTLRKMKVDNGVNYIPQSVQTKERDSKPNTVKNFSLPFKQNKKLAQNSKFINKDTIRGGGFRVLK